MEKWADYLISEVVYGPDNLIFRARRHKDMGNGVSAGETVGRLVISSDIASGKDYVTIHGTPTSWKKGHKIKTFRLSGNPYIRIDCNKVTMDFLGDVPELQGYESELEQAFLELEDKSADESESSTDDEPPPKPTPEPKPTPKDSPTPKPRPRGSLPKDTDEELPQELELLPDEAPQDSPESIPTPKDESPAERLDDLKSQLAELENSLSNIKLLAKTISKQKGTKSVKKTKSSNKKTADPKTSKTSATSQNKPQGETDTAKPLSEGLVAYCVKCKEKRQILNPEDVLMKNGRNAIRGACSACGCKVFMFVKKHDL